MIVLEIIKIIFVLSHLGMYSLVSINSNIQYFIFAFINIKTKKYTKSTLFYIFKGR